VTWDFRAAVGATVLAWLISAAPEAMPPVTDQDCSKQANDTAHPGGPKVHPFHHKYRSGRLQSCVSSRSSPLP
jgi:hypothetical protein